MGHVEHRDLAGASLPSVSQIPGIFAKDMDGFEDWICRGLHTPDDRCCTVAKRQFYAESADLGNDIHALREAFLRGKTFEEGVPEYQAAVFEPVANFYKKNEYQPLTLEPEYPESDIAVELKMTGTDFGGTLDGAGTFGVPFWEKQKSTFWSKETNYYFGPKGGAGPSVHDIWIEDLKIKSKLDPLHPLQLYGYSLLLKECYDIEAKWGLIIRREKKLDKKPEIQLKGYYLPAYAEAWNASMLMWRFLND